MSSSAETFDLYVCIMNYSIMVSITVLFVQMPKSETYSKLFQQAQRHIMDRGQRRGGYHDDGSGGGGGWRGRRGRGGGGRGRGRGKYFGNIL